MNHGLMFSFRNPPAWSRPMTDVYADEMALIREAEALGFDTIWLTEHHFASDGYSPSILPLAAAIAATTTRVRIGFNLLLLPLHDAVKVAEDIATLDVLSNGRIDVGVGQGYAVHEFAGFGVDMADRLGRFREGLDVLHGLWTNDTFSYSGEHYHIDDARLMPRPVQQPEPPLWIGATSEPGVRRAGRRGANLLGLASRRLQQVYEQARTEVGLDPVGADVLQLHWTHVADSDDQAWNEAAPSFHHLLSVYAEWANASTDADRSGPKIVIPPVEELRDSPGPLMFRPAFGSPASVAETIRNTNERMRTTHLALGVLPGMDPDHVRRSMQLYMSDVAPSLSSPPNTTSTA
jgi:alkanesulfonate monooxygenase SsuD/methylene tetrahydromethanopterin reductase-like flavin-dependent oxidoreductase (luciferase family)